jgi:hypothetical protein
MRIMKLQSPAENNVEMEGHGSYNRHARLQAGGGMLALPVLEQSVANLILGSGGRPVLIADYGSSQGRNSLVPIGVAVKALRKLAGPTRPICVVHVDLPQNDFKSLFDSVEGDPNSYAARDPNVFHLVVGRSFYRQVLPDESVDLAWSSYSAQWLSRVPATVPGHLSFLHSRDSVRAAFEVQSAHDWRTFLTLRARELRPGGRMVIVLPGLDESLISGFEDLMDHANEVLSEMVGDGTLKVEERERMVIGAHLRTNRELLDPFEIGGSFQGLTVERCEVSLLEDAAWRDYQRNRDDDALARKHASFFRTTFVPSLANSLTLAGDADRRRTFADRLESGLVQRLSRDPAPLHTLVQILVASKEVTVVAEGINFK